MTDSNGAIPATRSAMDSAEQFAEAGPERRYIEQLQNGAARPRPRPRTAAHAAHAAHAAIRAVEAVDKRLADLRHYLPTGP
jgi:multiple sugar transport system substrate-binding protein